MGFLKPHLTGAQGGEGPPRSGVEAGLYHADAGRGLSWLRKPASRCRRVRLLRLHAVSPARSISLLSSVFLALVCDLQDGPVRSEDEKL